MKNDKRQGSSRLFRTEFTEGLIDGMIESLDHRVHGEEVETSPWSLCVISAASVQNFFHSLW